jgi:signal transduction histidine kinase
MATLYIANGRDQGKRFTLTPRPLRVGRDSTCQIRLADSEASRTHAEITPSEREGFELVDLGSSNGTVVNGTKVVRHKLVGGDRILIGSTLLLFEATAGDGVPSPGHDVDIVGPAQGQTVTNRGDASRIVSSLSSAIGETRRIREPLVDAESSVFGSRRQQADRNLELMYATALAVGRTDSIPELLDRILKLVFDWVAADRGCVMLREGDSERLTPAARIDRDIDGAPPKQKGRMAISRTILDYVIQHREGVRTSDALDDERFDAAHSIVTGGVREALCVPLQGRYAVVGAIYVDTYTSPGAIIRSGYHARFNDEHLRLMTAIGYQAALAIEDAYYYSAMLQSERLAAMGQTIATLSHHIKNILQGMRGGSYLIDAGLRRNDTDAVRRGWGIVERNQERISSLVMDMLTFSKEREPEKVTADLNDTVQDVVELMRSRAAELGVELIYHPQTEMPQALFDPDAMHRAILNIVTNAIDAAAEKASSQTDDKEEEEEEEEDATRDDDEAIDADAEVRPTEVRTPRVSTETPIARVSTEAPPRVLVATEFDAINGWTIAVKDNGTGIRPEDREKIFSLFESRKGARGTGLGLPVSEKILREHGGRIELAQDDAGKADGWTGACFLLRLPPPEKGSAPSP